jgi:uncharacterized protein with FMN-binding domain
MAKSLPVVIVVLFALASAAWADRIELLSGASVEGEIADRDDNHVTIRVTVGSRVTTRKFPVERIHAITQDDKREVLNEMPEGQAKTAPRGTSPKSRPKAAGDHATQRTKAQIEALIQQEGTTLPEWWDSTPLEYPNTLDLSFPEPAPGPWNEQRNVGQYLWGIINPNPGRWRSGIRFMRHVLEVNKNNAQTRMRVMNTLGQMYCRLLQDYPRAAYWWRKSGADGEDYFGHSVHLAECYWRMGSKPMALDLLDRAELQYATIKLLGDMGETDRALKIAQSAVRGSAPDFAYLYAAEACRVAGRHKQALVLYERVLTVPAEGQRKGRIERNHRTAQTNIEGIKLFDLLDLARVPDGTYRSNSLGYEAPVHVAVTVRSGRIEDVKVTEHREKQYYSSITDTCRKIVARQGVTGIDATSSATITSESILTATAKALAGAMK